MGVQTDGACGGVEPCDVVVVCGVVVGVCLVVVNSSRFNNLVGSLPP